MTRLTRRFLTLVLQLAISVAAIAILPGSAMAQRAAPQCIGALGNQNVAQYHSYSQAVEVDKQQRLQLGLLASGNVGAVQVKVSAGPWSKTIQPVTDRTTLPPTAWSGTIAVSDYAGFGTGLYKVNMTSSGGCDVTFWANVTGPSPIATPAGGAASLTLLAGLATQGLGIIASLRRRNGFLPALLGGVPVGLAACVLSQQAGLTPITPMWALTWTLPPVSVGGVLEAGIRALIAHPEPAGEARPAMILHAPPYVANSEPAMAAPTATEPREAEPMPTAAEAPPRPIPMAPPPDAAPTTAEPAPEPAMSPQTEGWARAEPPEHFDDSVVRSLPDTEVSDGLGAGPEGPEGSADPPRTAYAYIEGPGAVLAETEFEIAIGLSPQPVAGVAGDVLVRPESSVGAYALVTQVVAEGFSLRDGETWRNELPVTAEFAYPILAMHLKPDAQTEPVRARTIQVIYSVAGHSMGLAVRAVAVVNNAALLATTPTEPATPVQSMSIPTNEPAADLTVRIQRGDSDSGGRLLWTFDTPHGGIELPDEPRTTDIGSEPEKFARQLVDAIGVREGQPGLNAYLIGIGRTVADQMPVVFWDLLRQTAERARAEGRQASVFLLSEEPYVPWELAAVEPGLTSDATIPPFLGAQACVGRWVLGQRRPTLPPPLAVEVKAMAVVSGVYNQPGWNRLVEAEEEASTIAQAYGATAVSATTNEVLQCLGGVPPADALHFAVHGIYDPNSVQQGIVLTDGQTLDPLQVKGSLLGGSPLVFLNACQVGSANKLLGDYSGMASAFLYAGAAGVVAPLWSVKDTIAKEIALRFYQQAFAGQTPAEVLRRERSAFHGLAPGDSATCLAYVWYGHPSFKLNRQP